jgi:hypothetical protein
MLSACVSRVPLVGPEYRSVRQVAVPPRYSCTVRARGLEASILPRRVLNSASVMSLVRHSAAAGVSRLPAPSKVAGVKGLRALGGQRRGQDVGGGVQVVLRVAADQFLVLREGHVALQHTGAHARGGHVALARVFRELQAARPGGRSRRPWSGTPACRPHRPAAPASAGRRSSRRRGSRGGGRSAPARRRRRPRRRRRRWRRPAGPRRRGNAWGSSWKRWVAPQAKAFDAIDARPR